MIRPFVPAALAAVLMACGGGAGEPPATPSPTSTAAATSALDVTATAELAPDAERPESGELSCPNPYLEGSPDEAEPGELPRIHPTGAPGPLAPYQPMPFTPDSELGSLVLEAIEGEEEHFAVVVKDLSDGSGVMIAPDRVFYAASLYKTWVMVEAYHQREAGLLAFDERYIVSDHYAQFGLNPGEFGLCAEFSLEQAMAAMMGYSDNVAANLLLDRVGAGNVNAAVSGLGLAVTQVPADGSLPTSARDMAHLLEAVAQGRVVGPEASQEMIARLGTEAINDRLPALLPGGTRVAHKTGSWDTATHDAGIVFSPAATYVIVVLTDYGYADNAAERIARLSWEVYRHFNP